MASDPGKPAPGKPERRGEGVAASRQMRERAAAGLLPHEFLFSVMRGGAIGGHVSIFDQEAAKAATPFYAPKLSAVEATLLCKPFKQISDEELQAIIDEETAALAAGRAGRMQ